MNEIKLTRTIVHSGLLFLMMISPGKTAAMTSTETDDSLTSGLITQNDFAEQCPIIQKHNAEGDFATEGMGTMKNETAPEPQTQSENSNDTGKPQFSLRANLLRWVTLTPDLGVEWRINPDWSVLVNGTWTSWSWDSKNRRYALWEVSPEARYHLGAAKKAYIGAMFHVGQFNYKLSTTAKQGDILGGGITGGYLLRLSDPLSLDFSIGVGYTHADYERYVVIDNVRVRCGEGSKNYWGVNHLGITLVWHLK